MNQKIISYQNEIEKLQEHTRKVTEQDNEKIKKLKQKIKAEKEKEEKEQEAAVVKLFKEKYGTLDDATIKKFKELMSTEDKV